MNIKTIKFSYNWNGKLDCPFFTTIRLYPYNNFSYGDTVNVERSYDKSDNNTSLAIIVHKDTIRLKEIPECVFFTDTGYNKENSIRMFINMYKNRGIDNLREAYFDIIVLKNIKELNTNPNEKETQE